MRFFQVHSTLSTSGTTSWQPFTPGDVWNNLIIIIWIILGIEPRTLECETSALDRCAISSPRPSSPSGRFFQLYLLENKPLKQSRGACNFWFSPSLQFACVSTGGHKRRRQLSTTSNPQKYPRNGEFIKSVNEDVVYYIFKDLQPFSAVKDKKFVRLVHRLDP